MKEGLGILVVVGSLLLSTLAFSQMGMGGRMGGPGMMGRSEGGVSVERHRYIMSHGIDEPYASARNPLAGSDENVKTGKAIFEQNCASCHGMTGRGDGPASQSLKPPPADLTSALKMPIASDAYLDWTISEGGTPVQSAMPPFKAALTSDQIWKLVLFLRTF